MIEIISELDIDAPAKDVWSYFIDSRNWPAINGMLRDSNPGTEFTRDGKRKLSIIVKELPPLHVVVKFIVAEEGHLCWRGAVPGFTGEHYFRAEPLDGGKRTRWVHGERFSGLLSGPILAIIRKKMERGYREFNYDLAEAYKRAKK